MFHSAAGLARAVALTAALAVATACSERRTAERADSDLAHDLALAGQINGQPALKDTAVAPAPQPDRQALPAAAARPEPQSPVRQPVPQPAPAAPQPAGTTATTPVVPAIDSAAMAAAAPAPAAKTIAAGTGLALSSGMRVCTNTNKVGDKLVATVTSPVEGEGGATIPAGSRVVLEVAQVVPGDSPDSSRIVLRPTAMYVNGMSYAITGDVSTTSAMQRADAPQTGASDKEKVAGGAVVGAILGQLLGHDTKSTIVGAAAGAATGAVVAHAQKSYQTCLPEGASLVLTLGAPVTMN